MMPETHKLIVITVDRCHDNRSLGKFHSAFACPHARWRTQTAWLSHNPTFFFKNVDKIEKYNFFNNSMLDYL